MFITERMPTFMRGNILKYQHDFISSKWTQSNFWKDIDVVNKYFGEDSEKILYFGGCNIFDCITQKTCENRKYNVLPRLILKLYNKKYSNFKNNQNSP